LGGIQQPKGLAKAEKKLSYKYCIMEVETWTIKASGARRITAAEMKYMRRTAGYSWDRLQNKYTNCKGI